MEVKTIVDEIYEEIKKKGKVAAKEIINKYKIDYLLFEEWMEELQKDGLVKIEFPTSPFGDMVVYLPEVWEHEKGARRKRD